MQFERYMNEQKKIRWNSLDTHIPQVVLDFRYAVNYNIYEYHTKF